VGVADGSLVDALNAVDEIDGGAGDDTLSVVSSVDIGAPIVVNVENLVLRSTDDKQVLDLANFDTSLETITLRDSANDINLDNIQNNVSVTITNVSDNVDIDFDDDALDSDAATFSVTVDDFTGILAMVVGGDDVITTLAITASGDDSAVTTDLATIETLTIGGTAALELIEDNANDFDTIETVNASANSGGITIDFASNDLDIELTGSSGDDDITLSENGDEGRSFDFGAGDDTLSFDDADADITIASGSIAGDSFDGGAGDDTVAVTGDTGADVFGQDVSDVFTNFETLLVTTDDDDTLDMDNVSSIPNLIIRNGADGDTMDVTNIDSQTVTIQTGTTSAADVIGEITLALADATATDDAFTINVVSRFDGTTNAITNLEMDDVEDLTVNVNYLATITTAANQVFTITGLEADAAETVTFTGNADLVVTFDDAVTDAVITAAAVTGSIDLTYLQAADVTITGSAGDDTFTMTSNHDGDDTVDGGDGDDTLELAVATGVTVVAGTITNVETVAVTMTLTQGNATNVTNTFNAEGVASGTIALTQGTVTGETTEVLDDLNVYAVSNLQAGTTITLSGDFTSAEDIATVSLGLETATGSSDALTVFLTEVDGTGTVIASLVVADVETVTISVTTDDSNATIDNVEITDLSADGAETIVIISEEDIDISLTESDSLETIDATAATRGLDIDLNGSTDDTGVEILLANAAAITTTIAITLDLTDTGADVITVNDTTVGAITIVNFDAGAGLAKDKIDLSAYGITGVADMTFGGTANVTIDISSDDNFGLITLTGVTQAELVADNFIFA
jgi:hypothetical protein